MADGVELELDAKVADGLGGLDEGAAHVVIADQRLAEGDAGLGGVTDGGGGAGVGNGDDDIGIDGVLARQQAAEVFARFLHGPSEDDGIGPREIDVFKDAVGVIADGGVALASHALGADDDHLAGIDVAEIDGVDEIEGAGLGSEDVAGIAAGKLHLAESERPETVGIARDDDAVLGQEDQ